jgi:hypothetical protein
LHPKATPFAQITKTIPIAVRPSATRGVELLRDRDEGHVVSVEELDQLGKVGERPWQPAKLVCWPQR